MLPETYFLMNKSMPIAISRKEGVLEYDQHRTISTMRDVTNILLKIIMHIVRTKKKNSKKYQKNSANLYNSRVLNSCVFAENINRSLIK